MSETHHDSCTGVGRAAPIRSCGACRARAPRDRLLRFVAVGEGAERTVALDLGRTEPGRGLNLGPSPLCLARAVKRGAFQRQWRLAIDNSDLERLTLTVREALRSRLRSYLMSAWRRGGLVPVAVLDEVEPAEARALWQAEELSAIVSGIPPARASNPRIAARIKALMSAVSEFTFTFVGGMKRRPEAPEACEALERCGGALGKGAGKTRRARVGAEAQKAADGRNG